mmetsp:Transcript_119316/g.320248  ORF Transcript_119316/g.320248 Transcript_119316/m.320248 type:complete len:277 (+) Transcript_119316:239-1069(+)
MLVLFWVSIFTTFCGTVKHGLSTLTENSTAVSKGFLNSTVPCLPLRMAMGPWGCGGCVKPVSSALYSPPPGPDTVRSAFRSPSDEGVNRTAISHCTPARPNPHASAFTSFASRMKSATLPPLPPGAGSTQAVYVTGPLAKCRNLNFSTTEPPKGAFSAMVFSKPAGAAFQATLYGYVPSSLLFRVASASPSPSSTGLKSRSIVFSPFAGTSNESGLKRTYGFEQLPENVAGVSRGLATAILWRAVWRHAASRLMVASFSGAQNLSATSTMIYSPVS